MQSHKYYNLKLYTYRIYNIEYTLIHIKPKGNCYQAKASLHLNNITKFCASCVGDSLLNVIAFGVISGHPESCVNANYKILMVFG